MNLELSSLLILVCELLNWQEVILERSFEVGVPGTVYCKVGNLDFCTQLSY